MDSAILAGRLKGIGSSDAPVICGLSPFKTAAQLYYEKLGVDFNQSSLVMDLGTFLEPKVAQLFTERTGLAVEIPEPMMRHRSIPWMFANLDRVAGRVVVELKVAFHREGWGEDGTDEIPEGYIVQVQHQLAVSGFRTAYVAALLIPDTFRLYPIERNDVLIGRIIEKEAEFWGRIERQEAPPLDYGHASAIDMLGRINGFDPEARLLLPPELEAVAADYTFHGARIADAKKERDRCKAMLLEHMGSAAEAVLPNGTVLRRRRVERAGYTVKPSEYVSFAVKPVKTGEPT